MEKVNAPACVATVSGIVVFAVSAPDVPVTAIE
jgi:hypothetical protein